MLGRIIVLPLAVLLHLAAAAPAPSNLKFQFKRFDNITITSHSTSSGSGDDDVDLSGFHIVNTAPPRPVVSTWTIRVEVGESTMFLGDISDPAAFDDPFSKPCGDSGCDQGSPQTFDFAEVDNAGRRAEASGEVVMGGNWDDFKFDGLKDALFDALKVAFGQTIICETKSYESGCMTPAKRSKRNGKRENAPQALGCSGSSDASINQCTAVNFLQATAYDTDGDQQGQLTMTGKSEDPAAFPCEDFFDQLNSQLGFTELPAIDDITTIATAICTAATGEDDDDNKKA